MGTARRSGSAALLIAALAGGCHPTCREVCDKLLGCEEVESPRVSEDECRDACAREEALYESWEDYETLDLVYEERSCIADEECGAIAEGACYDEELFVY